MAHLVLTASHVAALLVWIGSLAAIALVANAPDADAKIRGALARRVYLRAAVPGFVVAFVIGLVLLGTGWGAYGYAKAPWLHAKLTAALGVIALHHVVGARTRKMAEGGIEAGPIGVLVGVALLLAIAAAFLAIVRPF
jgi:putative membrane protein